MSRYIDAEMLVAVLKNLYEAEWNQNACTTWAVAFKHCKEFVNEQPTADVIPIEWIKEKKDKCFPDSITAISLKHLLADWEKERG